MRLPPSQLGLWAVAFTTFCLALGLPWIRWVQKRPLAQALIGGTPLRDAILGLSVGVLVAIAAWWAFLRISSLRRVLHQLRQVVSLEILSPGWVVLVAISAGVGEEVLFRGVIQPHLGLGLTSVLFGLAHPLSSAYIIYATLAALILGGLTHYTGALLAAMVAHSTVDVLMLLLAARWARHHTHQRVEGV